MNVSLMQSVFALWRACGKDEELAHSAVDLQVALSPVAKILAFSARRKYFIWFINYFLEQ
jgi:hypothetical protein